MSSTPDLFQRNFTVASVTEYTVAQPWLCTPAHTSIRRLQPGLKVPGMRDKLRARKQYSRLWQGRLLHCASCNKWMASTISESCLQQAHSGPCRTICEAVAGMCIWLVTTGEESLASGSDVRCFVCRIVSMRPALQMHGSCNPHLLLAWR